jgi:hypothetical protein
MKKIVKQKTRIKMRERSAHDTSLRRRHAIIRGRRARGFTLSAFDMRETSMNTGYFKT